jgi:serine/threonine protein kinase
MAVEALLLTCLPPGPLPTTRWEDLDVGAKLAGGTYGCVYACRLQGSSDELAVKVSKKDTKGGFLGPASISSSVLREAALQHYLGHHPNLQPMLAVVLRHESVGILMPRSAATLRDVLSAGTLPPEEVKTLALGMCRGLAHMHARLLLHCDLKPSNILVGTKDDPRAVRVADFGLARRGAGDRCRASAFDRPVASPSYRAPELLLEPAPLWVDVAADLWALGCVILELVRGHPDPIFFPREGRTPLQEIAVAMGPLPRRLAGNYPEAVVGLAARSLPKAYLLRIDSYYSRAGSPLSLQLIDLLDWNPEDRPQAEAVARGLAG